MWIEYEFAFNPYEYNPYQYTYEYEFQTKISEHIFVTVYLVQIQFSSPSTRGIVQPNAE